MVAECGDKYEAFECDEIDARLHLVFDSQDKPRLGTDKPCAWSFGYANTRPHDKLLDEMAEALWQMLDDIDTYSDMFKTDYEGFYRATMKKVAERHKIMHSDGFKLTPALNAYNKSKEG